MRYCKLVLCIILLLALLAGCGTTEPKATPITIDNSYVIVSSASADDTQKQAANCLQATFAAKLRLRSVDIVTDDPGQKAIVLAVDSNLSKGASQLSIDGSSLYIKAGDPHTLLHTVKQLRLALLNSTTVTTDLCAQLSGQLDYGNLPFTFMSQNILFKDIEGGNTVDERAPRFKKLMLEYQPDVLALQENSSKWTYYCKFYFKSTYHIVDDYGCNVLLRKDRFEVVKEGHFYMSPTPNIKSQFEGDSGPRFCCWVLVKDILTDREFFISNAHLDWNNDTQRSLQLEVMLEQMDANYQQYPSIACGDFNSVPSGPIYARMTERFRDSHVSAAQNLSSIDFTCHSFGTNAKRIDYIFHNDGLQVNQYRILNDTYDGDVSDHYGLITEIQFAN